MATDPLVQIVDQSGNYVGLADMMEAFRDELIRNTVYIVLVSRDRRYLLQKRSASVPNYPGYWEVSAGGHIDVGESADRAAKRELREELGIGGIDLQQHDSFYFQADGDGRLYKYYAHVYTGRLDSGADLTIDEHEVSEVGYFTRQQVTELDVTPITKRILASL